MRVLCVLVIVSGLLLPEVKAQELADVINWTGEVTLEENDEVFTDRIRVRVEPDGFLIADEGEEQVREYTRSGELVNYFGEDNSEAPGGLRSPSAPLRMDDDTILVPNMGNGALSLFDANGNPLERHERIAKSSTFLIEPLPIDDRVLFVGPADSPQGTPSFLHHLDPASGEIKESFYPLPDEFGSHAGLLYVVSPMAVADTYQNAIAVGFLLSNEISLFDRSGNKLSTVEPDFTYFKEVNQTYEQFSRDELDQEFVRRSLFNTLFWLNEETLLVQFTNSHFDNQGERQIDRVLAAVTTDGEVLFEINDTPRLLAVDSENGELYFADPDHDFESHWRVGRINGQFLP